MKSLVDLAIFVRVVESKNLSEAARGLGLTPSAVSKRLARMEERLGVTLVHRTTRSVSLCEDGRVFYERSKRILADVSEAEDAVMGGRDGVRGRVRLSLPCSLARPLLGSHLPTLLEAHPQLCLDVSLLETSLDPMRDGVDVVVSWERHADASLLQRRLTTSPVRVFAARRYLARRGVPRSPAALAQHDCLTAPSEKAWRFTDGGRTVSVPVSSRVACASADALRELTVAGLGLAQAPELVMGTPLPKGVEAVLDDFAGEERPLYARCAPAHPLSARVRAVMDWLADAFR